MSKLIRIFFDWMYCLSGLFISGRVLAQFDRTLLRLKRFSIIYNSCSRQTIAQESQPS